MRKGSEDLAREVAALADLPRDDLAVRWHKTYGCPPPKGVRRQLLIQSVAWHLQVKRQGGFSPSTRRLLKAAMADVERNLAARLAAKAGASAAAGTATGGKATPANRRGVAPGTRLIREWNGQHHVVDVIEEGFVYDAKTFKSLSSIARQITGAHWSGPRFFGV